MRIPASRRAPRADVLKPHAVVDTTIDTVRDETFLPERGQVRYELTLNDEQVELLARGIVSEALCCRAYKMLEWKRMNNRARARQGR